MRLLLRHKLLVGAVALVAAASAGGAYAATSSSSNPQQAFINDVAKRLNVSPAQLTSAFKGALIDRLNAAVRAGKLTQAQANRIEQRLNKRGRLPLFFVPPRGFGGPGRPGLSRRGALDSAASYLGLSETQLITDLRSGQSLAQIATAHGKSVSGLEQAILGAERTRLDQAQSRGLITTAQEQRLLSKLSARISRLVNRSGFPRGPIGAPHGAAGPQGGPMTPGGPPPSGPAPIM